MKKENSPLSYELAFAELQQLLTDLQGEGVGIDELAAKIERARKLIQFCRDRLRETEHIADKLRND